MTFKTIAQDTTENKRIQGQKIEQKALEYLLSNGYELIQQNWYFGHKEVDIIVENNEFRVFVEVKSRFISKTLNSNYQNLSSQIHKKQQIQCNNQLLDIHQIIRKMNETLPENKVDQPKKKSMTDCASKFSSLYPTHKKLRFDIISYIGTYYGFRLNHFKDAFSPIYYKKSPDLLHFNQTKNDKKRKRCNVFYI